MVGAHWVGGELAPVVPLLPLVQPLPVEVINGSGFNVASSTIL